MPEQIAVAQETVEAATSMLYVVDPASGEISGAFAGPSPAQAAEREGKGFEVIQGPEGLDWRNYLYMEGEFTPRVATLQEAQAAAKARLDADYEAYAQARYPIAWRDSAREFRELFRQVANDPEATTEQLRAASQGLALLDGLQAWLFKGLLIYYTGKAQAIAQAEDIESVPAWDFATDMDATDPKVSMGGHLVPLAIAAGVVELPGVAEQGETS